MVASAHSWQFVHSATSMIMFHLAMENSEYFSLPDFGEGEENYFAGTRLAASSVRLMPLSRSSSAKVADMCSVRPSHSSTCTSALAPASEWVDLVWVRSGVSRLRQPPRSTDLPGSRMGS